MGFEQRINYVLNRMPFIKKGVKRVYQRTMYAISPKTRVKGDVVRLSPDDPAHEYFFGYYDKCPWDITDRYVLCVRANDTWSDVSPRESADLLVIDTDLPDGDENRVRKIGESRAWNVQQACMLQWLGPDYSSRILYNDCRDGKYVSVIKDIESSAERVIPAPVYTVSADGRTALTLDFSRLYNLRPGYGYYNVPEATKGVALPDGTAVWKVDLETGKVTQLLSYRDFATFQPRKEMQEAGSVHKVNHLMLSPNGERCMVLYRWFIGQRKYTRLVTFDTADGGNMYVLSDDDMVSHCFWKDDRTILAFENKRDGGTGYYLMQDRTQVYTHLWPGMSNDGHPSYSPDRRFIITDSYPNRSRLQSLTLLREQVDTGRIVASVFAPFRYDNDTRCDLHPRWNRAGTKICFDSVYEGHRGLYAVDVAHLLVDPKGNGFDMDRIRFIMPLHGYYSQMIQNEGYDIKNPYTGNAPYKRIFREISFRLRHADKERWFNRENITDKKIIIVFEPLIIPAYIDWLTRVNPEAKVMLLYINKVNAANNPNQFDRSKISIWSGDRADCDQYGLNYIDAFSYFKACKVKKAEPEYDVFFVGKDKSRLDDLLEMQKRFEALGLKTYFHIVAERRIEAKRNRHYKPFLSYDEVLKYIGKSRAILYLSNGAQDGITIRVMESLIHQVKLITDNARLKRYDFFDPRNIFILGERDLSELRDFVYSPYVEVESRYLKDCYFEDMIGKICLDTLGEK